MLLSQGCRQWSKEGVQIDIFLTEEGEVRGMKVDVYFVTEEECNRMHKNLHLSHYS